MADIAAITGTIGSIKAILDISKTMVGVRDASVIQSKVFELQGQIIAAQSDAMSAQGEHAAMLQRVRDLEKEVADLKTWGTDKQRYELSELPAGGLAYRVKEEMRGSEPSHHICAACYQRGQKSVLQPFHHPLGRSISLDCSSCGARVYQSGQTHPGHSPPIRGLRCLER